MEHFVKTVNGTKLLTIFAKGTILDVSQGSEYAPVYGFKNWFMPSSFLIYDRMKRSRVIKDT